MSSPTPTPDKGSRVRRLVGETGWTRTRAVLSLGMVFGLGAVGTMAAWSDTASATTGVFSVDAVNVQMKLDGQRPTLNFVALNKVNLPRGGSVAAMLPVNNTGNQDFTYTAAAVTADSGTATYGLANVETLAQNLTVTTFSGGSAGDGKCTGGTQISSKPLAIGSVGVIDAGRRVNVNATDNLCIQVQVNPNAPVGARMSAVSVDFRFAATQAT